MVQCARSSESICRSPTVGLQRPVLQEAPERAAEQIVVALRALRIVALDIEDMPPPDQSLCVAVMRRHRPSLNEHRAAASVAQLVALDLAGRRARQIGDHLEPPRLLVARQRLRQPLARRRRRRRAVRAGRRHDVEHDLGQADVAFAQHRRAFGDRGMAGQRILDLGRRNPDARHPQHVAGAAAVMIEALGVAEIFVAGREPAVRPELLGRTLRRLVERVAGRAIALADRRHPHLEPPGRVRRADRPRRRHRRCEAPRPASHRRTSRACGAPACCR